MDSEKESRGRGEAGLVRRVSDNPQVQTRPPNLSSSTRAATTSVLQHEGLDVTDLRDAYERSDVSTDFSVSFSGSLPSSMLESNFHQSWSVGDGDFLSDGGLGPALRHGMSSSTQSISLRNMSKLAQDDPSMIHDAARIANWRTVKDLCRSHPQYAAHAGQDGWTALHHACNRRCPHADVAEALIRAYPDALLEVESQGERTPLHLACRFKAPKDVVRHLIHLFPEKGRAAVSKRDRKGRTPLYYAVRYDAPPGVMEMLLETDPSIGLDEDRNADSPLSVVWDSWAEKIDGRRALHPFLHPDEANVPEENRSRFLREKLAKNAKLSKRWDTVNLLLRTAFRFPSNAESFYDELKEAGDDEKVSAREGSTTKRRWRVLHAASAIKCHVSLFMMCQALFPEQASEFDENDLYGSGDANIRQTALHLASSSPAKGETGRAVMATLLSLYPEAAQVADSIDGSLPLHRIVENDRKMHWVVDGVRDIYVAYPAAIQTADKFGRLPLHRAVALPHHDESVRTLPVEVGSVICNLLEAFPEAAAHADNWGRLPLHLIAEHGEVWDEQTEAVLNAHPASVRVRAGQDLHSRLPIHMAAGSPDARGSLIDRLVELHPQGVNQTDRLGKLPLHLACESGKMWDQGVSAIYEAGVNAIRQPEGNNRRWLALHMAAASPNAGADLIDKLIDLYPRAANESDAEGRFPLHLASAIGKSWDGGLQSILAANPDAILSEDRSGMLPFHVVAICHCSRPVSADRLWGDDAVLVQGISPLDVMETDQDAGPVDGAAVEKPGILTTVEQEEESSEAEIAKVDLLFNLLRAEPSVLAANGSDYCF